MIRSMNTDESTARGPDGDSSDHGDRNADVPAEGLRPGHGARPSWDLFRAARLLPLVTVAAWIITIFVPILDSGNADGPRITITSLGDSPLDPEYLNPGFIAIWVLIVVFALLPWLFGAEQWWSAAAILFGVVILLGLAAAVINPPFLMWDGQTDDGMPTGGMEVVRPDFGFVLCAIGGFALGASGFCGWIGGQRLKHRAAA